jgi:hypothetical protein
MMRTAEGGLHYYINGEDQGLAIDGVPPGVYAVIDLYGVCGQVNIFTLLITGLWIRIDLIRIRIQHFCSIRIQFRIRIQAKTELT